MKKAAELVVITKTYDLILWSCNHTGLTKSVASSAAGSAKATDPT
ncbi:MAG TPA: hypothetical protein VMX74_15400 [Pirellulales bacterium]|nr:hypothetical protein [Pirellulales bacterium]